MNKAELPGVKVQLRTSSDVVHNETWSPERIAISDATRRISAFLAVGRSWPRALKNSGRKMSCRRRSNVERERNETGSRCSEIVIKSSAGRSVNVRGSMVVSRREAEASKAPKIDVYKAMT